MMQSKMIRRIEKSPQNERGPPWRTPDLALAPVIYSSPLSGATWRIINFFIGILCFGNLAYLYSIDMIGNILFRPNMQNGARVREICKMKASGGNANAPAVSVFSARQRKYSIFSPFG